MAIYGQDILFYIIWKWTVEIEHKINMKIQLAYVDDQNHSVLNSFVI